MDLTVAAVTQYMSHQMQQAQPVSALVAIYIMRESTTVMEFVISVESA